jgi:WD40 repeat protein
LHFQLKDEAVPERHTFLESSISQASSIFTQSKPLTSSLQVATMYQLAPIAGHSFGRSGEVYVLDLHRLASGLASISSDQKLSLFNPARVGDGPVASVSTNHGNLRSLKPFDWTSSAVCTAGENGTVALWDLRQGPSRAQVAQFQGMWFCPLHVLCEMAREEAK